MRNHAEKQRDMARSVLPSTARKGARFARRRSHKTARQAIRTTLHGAQRADHPDDIDDPIDRYSIDVGRTTSGYNDEWLVGARRSADKVAPLVRWAGAIIERTPSLRDGDYGVRRNHFKALLPDTLQGRHALSHLDGLFGSNGDWRWIAYEERERRRLEEHRQRVADYDNRKMKLLVVLEGAGPRRLNHRIGALTPPIEPMMRRFHDGRGWTEERAFVPVKPWVYDGRDPARWLGKPTQGLWGRAPLTGNAAAQIAHRALDEVFAEMFGGRLPSQ